MRFEFDPTKSAVNKVKHGIDYEETIRLISVRRARGNEKTQYLSG